MPRSTWPIAMSNPSWQGSVCTDMMPSKVGRRTLLRRRASDLFLEMISSEVYLQKKSFQKESKYKIFTSASSTSIATLLVI